jgi:xylulokinase
LISKLPEIKSADTKAAKICNYFKDKYGFKEECNICLASGDNPNSLIGCGASEPGTVVISMGTSDTFFGAVGFNTIDTQGIGHIFGNPAGGYMSLICFRNGSLSREIALKTTGLNWVDAEKFIAQNTPFEGENFKAFLIDEMYPKSKATLDEKTLVNYSKEKALVGLIESQILNIKCFADLHAKKIDTIRITGGASQNKAIAQIIADVFQAKVERIQISNSAALGAAMRAAHSCSDTSWATLNNKFTSAEISFLPNLENAQIYSEKIAKYKSLIF